MLIRCWKLQILFRKKKNMLIHLHVHPPLKTSATNSRVSQHQHCWHCFVHRRLFSLHSKSSVYWIPEQFLPSNDNKSGFRHHQMSPLWQNCPNLRISKKINPHWTTTRKSALYKNWFQNNTTWGSISMKYDWERKEPKG